MKSILHLTFFFLSLIFIVNEKTFANDPCLATLLPPPPDTCAYIIGTTVGAASSSVSSLACSGINGNPDVWYKTIVPACGPDLIVNALIGSVPGFGLLYLYTGSCDSLAYIPCHSITGPSYFISDTLTSLAPGDTLFIRLRDAISSFSFSLCVYGACPTGLSELAKEKKNELQLYPNPSKNELSIISQRLPGKCEIEIDNILGKEMLRLESMIYGQPFTIDISGLSPGIYFLKLRADNHGNAKIQHRKVIRLVRSVEQKNALLLSSQRKSGSATSQHDLHHKYLFLFPLV